MKKVRTPLSVVKDFTASPAGAVTNYVLELMGLNFYYYGGLQPEMRAGIINEHECTRRVESRIHTGR